MNRPGADLAGLLFWAWVCVVGLSVLSGWFDPLYLAFSPLLVSVGACFLLVPFAVFRRPPTPAAFGAGIGGIWIVAGIAAAIDLVSRYREHGRALEDLPEIVFEASLGFLPILAWRAVRWAQRREVAALERRGAASAGDGVWRLRVREVDVRIERVDEGRPRRLLDRRAHVFTAPVPLPGAVVRRRATVRSELPWRYWGPSHLPPVWLAGDVPERLGAVLSAHAAHVEDGVLTVRTKERLTEAVVHAIVSEIAAAVEAIRASGGNAIPRIHAEARAAPTAVARVEAWRTLADHLPEGLRGLAPEGLRAADPVIRAIAARAVGDHAVMGAILARSEDPEAVRRAVEAVHSEGWTDLVDAVAERLGVHPEGAWLACVAVLAEMGGRAHVARLLEIVDGPGYPAELRAEAREALARIRARLGGDSAGRLSVAEGEGGELALAAEGGELALAAEGGELAIATEVAGAGAATGSARATAATGSGRATEARRPTAAR